MRETPCELDSAYPGDDLARYRYHTGAPIRALALDEACPVLFRDLGLEATARFLRGALRRLAGPLTPITYVRTEGYVEPYTDHEQTGRLIFLRPLLLAPWHAGVPHVYVARATNTADADTIGFVPGNMPLAQAANLAADMRDVQEWRDALGGRLHDDCRAETLARLDRLAAELESTERWAGPLRRSYQSPDQRLREHTREEMRRLGISEIDLCSAWHHLPRERRAFLAESLRRLRPDVHGS